MFPASCVKLPKKLNETPATGEFLRRDSTVFISLIYIENMEIIMFTQVFRKACIYLEFITSLYLDYFYPYIFIYSSTQNVHQQRQSMSFYNFQV